MGSNCWSGNHSFSPNTIEIAVWVKTIEGYHTIAIDPWSLHSQLREWGPNFHPYPELRAKMGRLPADRRKRLDTLCQTTCRDLSGVPLSVGSHGPSWKSEYSEGSLELIFHCVKYPQYCFFLTHEEEHHSKPTDESRILSHLGDQTT